MPPALTRLLGRLLEPLRAAARRLAVDAARPVLEAQTELAAEHLRGQRDLTQAALEQQAKLLQSHADVVGDTFKRLEALAFPRWTIDGRQVADAVGERIAGRQAQR